MHLTVLFLSFKIKFNPLVIRHMAGSIQLLIVNNILKANFLTYNFSVGIEKVHCFYILFPFCHMGILWLLITGQGAGV